MGRNKLYTILGVICLAGFGWLFFSIYNHAQNSGFGVCMFKQITSIPCPSCGSTRALVLLLQGDLIGSVLLNPFGILSAMLLLIVPVWIIYDLVSKKKSLFNSYQKAEEIIRVRWIGIVLVFLVLINWMWNIHKNL